MESLRQTSTSTIEDPIKHCRHPLLMGAVEWGEHIGLEFQLKSNMYSIFYIICILKLTYIRIG